MPELPDLTVYLESLAARIANRRLLRVRLLNPFLLRTALPPITAAEGRKVLGLGRVGKRIVVALEGELYLVLHLMVAGRLRWDARTARGITLAHFEFDSGTLAFTEAGTRRRASLHLVAGKAALNALDPGGLEVLDADLQSFAARLTGENHTLKRALTDPRLFAGIGNAYSDEILHRAKLSPIAMTRSLDAQEVERVFSATREVLSEWTARLRSQAAGAFPEKVTAFKLLRALPDRRQGACGPGPFAAAQEKLAALHRRAGITPAPGPAKLLVLRGKGKALRPSAQHPPRRASQVVGNHTSMQNIVRLDEYRKQRKGARSGGPQAPDAPRYFCLSCDTDHFKLYAAGTVHCAACGSLIRNVQIFGTPDR